MIEDDSLICEMVADCFRTELGAEVVCALTGPDGARMIMGYAFDLAVIDAVLPDVSGFALAELAANENLPVLMTSGHPLLSDQLVRFNFPHLRKPFDLNALIEEARTIISSTRQNIRRVQHSAATMRAHLEALEIALKEAHRLMAESKNRVASSSRCPVFVARDLSASFLFRAATRLARNAVMEACHPAWSRRLRSNRPRPHRKCVRGHRRRCGCWPEQIENLNASADAAPVDMAKTVIALSPNPQADVATLAAQPPTAR